MANSQLQSNNDRSSGELRALDCNLSSLCEHIQMEGYQSGSFYDIIVETMGTSYHLHRLILSRSSYFRNMLHGPWKEAGAPTLTLNIDDDNVNDEAIAMSLAYLYGHLPKLNDNNAFRVLAAASFLDLQDLCAICTNFIISELWTSNFLSYQVFAESQDYGIHGERVRNACWGYLCQSGSMELREMLPKLSAQTLHALLTSDELWVPSEEKRFELAINVFLAKGTLSKIEDQEHTSSGSESDKSVVNSLKMEKNVSHSTSNQGTIASELATMTLHDHHEGFKAVQKVPVDLADCIVDFQSTCYQVSVEQSYNHKMGSMVTMDDSCTEEDSTRRCSLIEMQNSDVKKMDWSGAAMEGPSENVTLCCLGRNVWHSAEKSSEHSLPSSSFSDFVTNDWGRGNVSSSWGGRVVSKQENNFPKGKCTIHGEDYAAFFNIFEGGSLLYCHMAFEALLNVRKQLEELGFPCKLLNDGLWLQMLLSQRVQETCAYTCKKCFLTSTACSCRQPCAFSHGSNTTSYVRQDHDGSNSHSNMGNMYLSDAQAEGNGIFGFTPMHIRGPNDGLAGIGQGSTILPTTTWPPTRYVYSRVPFALGNRNGQQSVANGETESRVDLNGDFPGNGLTALVELSQNNNLIPVHVGQNGMMYGSEVQTEAGPPSVIPCTSGITQVVESQDHVLGFERESPAGSIVLDIKTPLPHFPPFRFGVEFHDVHRISDGQVKNSLEVFYAGSLWKISIQAFNDEDPQGRRTLGLFLHRRRAEATNALQKAHVYIDSREKVMARYQLICPSKREVMVFGSLKQPGTLLPKAPKGWGWRTALLFDELSDLLQGGALRVAAAVQLV